MARMSSVIYVMHKRVSAAGKQANAHLDMLSLNSMQTYYISSTYIRSYRNRWEQEKNSRTV